MDLEKLPYLEGRVSAAIDVAGEVEQAIKIAMEAKAEAIEAIRPAQNFAQALLDGAIEGGVLNSSIYISPLIKVGEDDSGRNTYVFVRKQPNTSAGDNYLFITCTGVTLSISDYERLDRETQDRIVNLGSALDGTSVFGVRRVTEETCEVYDRYDEIVSLDNATLQRIRSEQLLSDIAKTIEYLKTGIITDSLNPGADAMFSELASQIVAERQAATTA